MADAPSLITANPVRPTLAVITARGGSKGLPMKNIRQLAVIPLIAHSIICAKQCSQIDRLIVSTDSEEIAAVARSYGADVPFLRPAALATDHAPTWPVLRHAMCEMEALDGHNYNSLLLLDPTSPGRLPSDIENAVDMLEADPSADGIVSVSEPSFNPVWTAVVRDNKGHMQSLVKDGGQLTQPPACAPGLPY